MNKDVNVMESSVASEFPVFTAVDFAKASDPDYPVIPRVGLPLPICFTS